MLESGNCEGIPEQDSLWLCEKMKEGGPRFLSPKQVMQHQRTASRIQGKLAIAQIVRVITEADLLLYPVQPGFPSVSITFTVFP